MDQAKIIAGTAMALSASIIASTSRIVEKMVQHGCISVQDGQAIFSEIAEEIRTDGDQNNNEAMRRGTYMIATELERRAFALSK